MTASRPEDRDRSGRTKARKALYKAIERYKFGRGVSKQMKKDFEDLANQLEEKQDKEGTTMTGHLDLRDDIEKLIDGYTNGK